MTVSYLRAENQTRAWITYDIYLKTTLIFVVASLSVYRLGQFWPLLVNNRSAVNMPSDSNRMLSRKPNLPSPAVASSGWHSSRQT